MYAVPSGGGSSLATIVEGVQMTQPHVASESVHGEPSGRAPRGVNWGANNGDAQAMHSADDVSASADGPAPPSAPRGIVRRSLQKVSMGFKQPFKKNLRKLNTGLLFETSFTELKAKISRVPVTARTIRLLVTAGAAAVFFFTFLLWQQGAPGSDKLHAVYRTRGGFIYDGYKATSAGHAYHIDLNTKKKLWVLDLIATLQRSDPVYSPVPPVVTFSLWANSTSRGVEVLRSKALSTEFDLEVEMDEVWNLRGYLEGREGLQGLWLEVATDSAAPLGFMLDYRQLGKIGTYRPLIAFFILLVTFGVMATDLINRMLVSIIGSFTALTVLTAINGADSIKDTVLAMDVATLCLMFSMMIIVEVLSQTGLFEYVVFRCLQISGRVPLYFMVLNSVACLVLSLFLPNVTTILMMGPITLSIVKSMEMDPTPFIIMLAVFGEIAGCATLISDTPNLIIANWTKSITFLDYIKYVFPGVIFLLPAVFFCLWRTYKNRVRSN